MLKKDTRAEHGDERGASQWASLGPRFHVAIARRTSAGAAQPWLEAGPVRPQQKLLTVSHHRSPKRAWDSENTNGQSPGRRSMVRVRTTGAVGSHAGESGGAHEGARASVMWRGRCPRSVTGSTPPPRPTQFGLGSKSTMPCLSSGSSIPPGACRILIVLQPKPMLASRA